MFDWAEELLDEAESIYLTSKKHLFTDFDVIKFMLKKSSFLKKYGFFDDSLKLLDQLNKQLIDKLQGTLDKKKLQMAKKLKFKVHRDQARLFALKRDEEKAQENHKIAERILKEELVIGDKRSLNQSMRQEVSVKIAKL